MERLSIPEKLNLDGGNVADSWRKFRQRFNIYLHASGQSKKSNETKTCLFLHIAGDRAIEVYNSFYFDPDSDDKDNIDKVIEKFEAFCVGKKNIIMDRYSSIHVISSLERQLMNMSVN